MPVADAAPAWARELGQLYESGAHGQFVLYGNVHDRLPTGGRLVNLAHYVEHELLASFSVVFGYDLGNGLLVERGGEIVKQWGDRVRQPLLALSRQPALARTRRQRARRRHLTRRRSDPAGRRSRLRARESHQPGA